MTDKEICDEIEKSLRAQRHEFINHMQVVHTLIKMGRMERAIHYIEDLAKAPDVFAEPLKLHKEQDSDRRGAGL